MQFQTDSIVKYPLTEFTSSFLNLIGSQIEVEVVNNLKYQGKVCSIDPASGSIFLLCESSLRLVIGSNIRQLKIVKESSLDPKALIASIDSPEESLHSPKIKSLSSWLNESRIDFRIENSNIIVLNEVTIQPPYTISSCISTNELMLNRVQKLLSSYYSQ